MAGLHPSTVINHLHAACIGQVEAANVLKKSEILSRIEQSDEGSLPECGVYEETIKSQLQAAIMLPKVFILFFKLLQGFFKFIFYVLNLGGGGK